MTITNIQLEQLFKNNNIVLTNIVMSDKLKMQVLQPFMNVIINLQTSKKQGSHWTALLVRDKNAMYFDSFGAKCDTNVIRYCEHYGLKLGINTYTIQAFKSTECGLFCYALCKYVKTEKIPPVRCFKEDLYELSNNYVNLYDMNTDLNDAILKAYMKREFADDASLLHC